MSETPNPTPLFGCNVCAEEWSFPASDLRVFEGELWCQECWDASDDRPRKFWLELDPFVPAHERRIRELEAESAQWRDLSDEWQARAGAAEAKLAALNNLFSERDIYVQDEKVMDLITDQVQAILRGEPEDGDPGPKPLNQG